MPKRPWPRPQPALFPVRATDQPGAVLADYLADMLETLEGIEAALTIITDTLAPLEDIKNTLARIEARRPVPGRRIR